MQSSRLDLAYKKGIEFEKALNELLNYERKLTKEQKTFIAGMKEQLENILNDPIWNG